MQAVVEISLHCWVQIHKGSVIGLLVGRHPLLSPKEAEILSGIGRVRVSSVVISISFENGEKTNVDDRNVSELRIKHCTDNLYLLPEKKRI